MVFAGLVIQVHGRKQAGIIPGEAGIVGYLFSFGNGIFYPQTGLSAPFLPFFVDAYITGIDVFSIDKVIRTVIGFPDTIIVSLIFHLVVILYITYFETGIEAYVIFERMHIIGFGRINVDKAGNISGQCKAAGGIAIRIIHGGEQGVFGVVGVTYIIQVGS